jgi:hypothetical protein
VIFPSAPALAEGGVLFTVTNTESLALQLLNRSVTVNVYKVVILGLAFGLEILERFKPAEGNHE